MILESIIISPHDNFYIVIIIITPIIFIVTN